MPTTVVGWWKDIEVAMTSTKLLGAAGLAAAVVAVRAGRTAGSLPHEVATALPGDELLPDAAVVSTHTVRIAASPEQVWPWLVQMGYGRGGWYAIDRLERMIGAGDFLTGGSAERVVPELQDLALGDRVPLSADLHLVVAHLDRPRALVLVVPTGPLGWVWSFTLWPEWPLDEEPEGDERGRGGGHHREGHRSTPSGTRLVVRTRTEARAGWLRPVVPVLDVGHLVMQSVQLRGLRRRIEAVATGDVGSNDCVQSP